MTSILPIKQLSINAENMVRSVVLNSPEAKPNIAKFLNYTNENNLHGPALVAYYTVFNNFKANSDSFARESQARIFRIPELIEDYVKKSPLLTKHSDEFLTKIEKLYRNSLKQRVSIASQGAVVADTVKPKSNWKKFFVWINQIFKSEIL